MFKRVSIAALIAGGLTMGTVAMAAASDDGVTATSAAAVEEPDGSDVDNETEPDQTDDVELDELDETERDKFDDPEWDEFDEIEFINAETDALVEFLAGRGFDVTVETVEIRKPVFDEEDPAIWEAIESFEQERFAAEAATWSAEEIAEWNAEIDEFIAELAELGVTAETTEIAPGVMDIVWTEELEAALDELDDAFERDDDAFDKEDWDEEAFDKEDWDDEEFDADDDDGSEQDTEQPESDTSTDDDEAELRD